MARAARTSGTRTGLHPFNLVNNALIWISAVIVMGILSYYIHHQRPFVSSHVIYEEVIAVLTVAFFVFSFFLGGRRHYHMLFNLIFSYLWLVSVVFTAQDWSRDRGTAFDHTVEAFSFIAL